MIGFDRALRLHNYLPLPLSVLRRLFHGGHLPALSPPIVAALDPAVMTWLAFPDAGAYTLTDCEAKANMPGAGFGAGPLARLSQQLLRAALVADSLTPNLARLGLLKALQVEMKVAFLLANMERLGLGFDPSSLAGKAAVSGHMGARGCWCIPPRVYECTLVHLP